MAFPKHLYKNGELKGEIRYVRNEEEELAAANAGFKELSGFQEFPKHLYKAGDREAEDLVVQDAKEEKAARAKGYKTIQEREATVGKE